VTQVTLLAGAGYAAAAALVYGFIAHRVANREASAPDVRLAAGLYSAWWAGVAATSVLVAANNVLGALGARGLPLYVALNYLQLLAVCLAVWGLLYYVVYLLWGNGGRTLTILSLFYGANVLIVLVHLTLAQPTGIDVGRWRTDLTYAANGSPATTVALGMLVLLPILLAVLGYFTVFFRAVDPTARYRVVAVTLSILVWLEGLLLAHVPSLADSDAWQMAGHLATFASSLIVLAAYHPPAWIARHAGLASAARPAPVPAEDSGPRAD
jgi:hypothetical protein